MTTDTTITNKYTWRAIRREDIPALYQMLVEADHVDGHNMIETITDMQRVFDDLWSDPQTDSLLGLDSNGQIAATARVYVNPQPEEECRAILQGTVHPDHRQCGLDEFILNWMETRGRERLKEIANNGMPCILRARSPAHLLDNIALIKQHGFQPERYFNRMRRDLSQPTPNLTQPQGIVIRAYGGPDTKRSDDPKLDQAVLEALNEAFSDHWSFDRVDEQEWQQFFTFQPEISFLAMEDDQVVGFCLNRINPPIGEQGAQEGWIADLGVRRAWRRRGIASALLCHSIRALKAKGLNYALLGVDTENPTGALSVYERLGFVAIKQFITFAKPVNW